MRDKVTFQQFACKYGWLLALAAAALAWWLAPVHVNAGYVVAVAGLLFSASMLVGTFLRRCARN